MAFDHDRQELNGIYDFGDAGFGPLHHEFVQTNLVSPDLTSRIIDRYEALTSRPIERNRVRLLNAVLRLAALAEQADDPVHAPAMLRAVTALAGPDLRF